MTAADISALPLRGLVIGCSDGTFRHTPEFLPGAIEAEIMLVRDAECEITDAVAWPVGNPGRWWTYSGTLEYIGEHELRRAWWDQDHARMVSRPIDYLDAHGSVFCVLRWDADIDDILGPVPGVVCDTPALASKLRRTLLEQCAERRRIFESAVRRFPIAVAQKRIAA